MPTRRYTWPKWRGSAADPANLREVAPHLFIGSEHSPRKGKWTLVVDMCGSSKNARRRYDSAERLVCLPFDDGHPIPEGYLEEALRNILPARSQGDVLVHCHAGLSRSASVAYAVLRVDDELKHREALRRVKTGPDSPWPHPVVLDSAREWVRAWNTELGGD